MSERDNISYDSMEGSTNPKFLELREKYSSLEAEELIAALFNELEGYSKFPLLQVGEDKGGGVNDLSSKHKTSSPSPNPSRRQEGDKVASNHQQSTINHQLKTNEAPHPTSPRKQGEGSSDSLAPNPQTPNPNPRLFSFSSFGSWSALLLHMIAEVDKNIPVLFLDTGKHFPETIKYAKDITKHLGLKNLITLTPDEKILSHADVNGNLWQSNVNRCCWIRKVEPLDRFIDENKNLEAIITGRRAYQTKEREGMQKIELDDKGKIRINPIAFWSKDKIKEEFKRRNLFNHPLVEQGYPSIGCAPCTRQVRPGEDERAGRWAHIADMSADGNITAQKQECGIHLSKTEVADWVI